MEKICAAVRPTCLTRSDVRKEKRSLGEIPKEGATISYSIIFGGYILLLERCLYQTLLFDFSFRGRSSDLFNSPWDDRENP